MKYRSCQIRQHLECTSEDGDCDCYCHDVLQDAVEMMDVPLYITDTGEVHCQQPGCPDGPWTPSDAGRRGTVADLLAEIARHIREDHT